MKTLIKVDLKDKPEKHDVLHNRWHPDIPMIAMVKPGDEFRVECVDWTGGQRRFLKPKNTELPCKNRT